MPENPDSIKDLYHERQGFSMPESWQDMVATAVYYRDNHDFDIDDVRQHKREELERKVAEYMEDNDMERFNIPEKLMEDKYPELTDNEDEEDGNDSQQEDTETTEETEETTDSESEQEEDEELDTIHDEEAIKEEQKPQEPVLDDEAIQRIQEVAQHRNCTEEEAVEKMYQTYEPFLKQQPNTVLRQIGKILVAEGELDAATEGNVVEYSLMGLMQAYGEAAQQAQEEAQQQAQRDQQGQQIPQNQEELRKMIEQQR